MEPHGLHWCGAGIEVPTAFCMSWHGKFLAAFCLSWSKEFFADQQARLRCMTHLLAMVGL